MNSSRSPQPKISSSAEKQSHRFLTLDALRGFAALMVVQVHLPFLFSYKMPFPHAYLAVDFFFMLSGFVLTYAYEKRLKSGWPTLFFLRERLIRIYPLYLLALPVGLAYLIYTNHRNHTPMTPAQTFVLFIFALFTIPVPFFISAGGPYPFPANIPGWSLFYELAMNVTHAALLRSRTRTQLSWLLAIMGAALIPIAYFNHGLNIGALKGEFLIGFVRVAFSYVLGMLLFGLWREQRLRQLQSAVGALVLLAAVLMSPVLPRGNLILDLLAISFVFPTALILAANHETSRGMAPVVTFLGLTSYAVYVLQVPAYAIFTTLWGAAFHTRTADYAPYSGVLYLIFLLGICYWLDRFYDLPLRRWLRQLTQTKKP